MSSSPEHVDVLIIGAGLSGIGAACHLQRRLPGKSFLILESRAAMGGTWDLFRYPGIRSDSDMFTLGYAFKPWEDAKAIADGPSIRAYIEETAREHGLLPKIRFHHRVLRADWSSDDARWTVVVERTDTKSQETFTCSFLFGCTGYYRYDQGYSPRFPGQERFTGTLVHPQHWPESLDYAGRRVVVIGSGATAVTLVPSLAEKAAHVTMLQRSPTYVVSLPARDTVANALRKVLPKKVAYEVIRWKNVGRLVASYQLSRRVPKAMKAFLRFNVRRMLPRGFDIDTHFTPSYEPWDQRLCLVPDGDLFHAIREGKASVVTERIESFTETGIRLQSGEELPADIIVTATGLNLQVLGGVAVTVDGAPVEWSRTVGYKGLMFSGVPNLAMTLGYTNASWTLKCDLVSEYVCRLLAHMEAKGVRQVVPRTPQAEVGAEPFIDLKAGYVLRALHLIPKQGKRAPWRLEQNYPSDLQLLRHGDIDDGELVFSKRGREAARDEPEAKAKPSPSHAA